MMSSLTLSRVFPQLLGDLEGHSQVAGLFKCNPSNICAAFTRFQLTVCSRGPSTLAELLVWIGRPQTRE